MYYTSLAILASSEETVSNTTSIDVVSIVLAVVALLVSIATFVLRWRFDKRTLNATFKFEYHKEVFMTFLMDEMPSALKNIGFNEKGCLNDNTRDIDRVLVNLKRKIDFYEYFDNDFYTAVNDSINNIDDFVSMSRAINDKSEKQTREILSKKIRKLYKVILGNNQIKS